jgi:hypothetical protein
MNWKDLKGSSAVVNEVLSLHFPSGTEENHADVGQNSRYRYTNLVCLLQLNQLLLQNKKSISIEDRSSSFI